MQRLPPFTILWIFLAAGCAEPEAYKAYDTHDKDNACMKQCYGQRQECGGEPGPNSTPPMGTQDDLGIILYCLALLDSCLKGCDIDTEEEDLDY